jgi:hypothetical protein
MLLLRLGPAEGGLRARNENKLSSYLAVRAVCEANRAVWQVWKGFSDANAEFNTVVDQIVELMPQSGRRATGLTQSKQRLREQLADVAFEVASATRAYAKKQGNSELAKKVDYTRSEIVKGRDLVSAARSHAVLSAATPVVGQLADFGVTQAELDTLEGLLEAYREEMPKPREAILSTTAANRKLRELFRKADALLHEQMSAFEPKFRKSAPEFAVKFAGAKDVVNAAASRGTANPEPAPAPVIA